MSYTLEINSVDFTSKLRHPSLIIDKMSDERAMLNCTLVTTSTDIGTTDGMYVGQSIEVLDGATTVFGGVIKKCIVRRANPDTTTSTKLYVDIVANDYREIASRRVITKTASSTTAGAIVTDIVDNELNLAGFSDNVTKGTINTGATINEYSSGVKTVKEILDDLATASGYKWTIDETKTLDFVQENTITAAPYDIVIGGAFTDYNVESVSVDLTNFRNKQWVLGATDSTGADVTISVENSASISSRATIENASGVYGDIINAVDSQSDTDATITANNAIKRYGLIPYKLVFTTFTNEFNPGTKLKANLPVMGINSDMYFLIESVTIEDLGGALFSTVECTRRDNSDFSTQRTEDYIDYFSNLVKPVKSYQTNVTTGNLFVQDAEPYGAPDGTLWVDTDDKSTYTSPDVVLPYVAQIDDGEVAHIVGGGIYTALDITTSLAGASDPNAELYQVVHNDDPLLGANITINSATGDTFNGGATITVTPQQSALMWGRKGKTNWTVRVI